MRISDWSSDVCSSDLLGVSSPQIDVAGRGFSFGKDGPLDMPMDPDSGESAAQWLARAGEAEIADVLWQYGEERMSRRIARTIVARRAEQPITRTAQLAELIASVMPRGKPGQKEIHPATRSRSEEPTSELQSLMR